MDREWVEGLVTGLVLAAVLCGAGVCVGLVWRRSYLAGRRERRAEREAERYLELAPGDPGPIGEPPIEVHYRDGEVLRLQREVRERSR